MLSDAFISELSLVAEKDDGEVIGHILFTRITIVNENTRVDSLALAPVSVLPEYQNKGIGKSLINEGLIIAEKLGFKSVIVLGHEKYYPKFGFKPASTWGIKPPFEVPDEVFMAMELEKDGLKNGSGVVEYAKAFYE